MEEIWIKELNNKNLTLDDIERSVRYAKDLTKGLATIKQYPQGVTVFGSARLGENNDFYKKAYELGAKLAQNGHPVITGGGPGIMEAANRGAFDNHGQSIGLNIKLETEQDLNPYVTDTMEFHYFFARKVMLAFSSKIYVYFPGGFGTLDEFSEILELVHTAKVPPAPIFLYGSEFWKGLDEWFAGKMSEWQLIETSATNEMNEMGAENPAQNRPADAGITKHSARELYKITDNIDEIVAAANAIEPRTVEGVMADIVGRGDTNREGKVF
jgi:uncharacterized protein (TIGR00730 family)